MRDTKNQRNIILLCINFLHCIPWNRTFCIVGYTAEGSFTVWDTAEEKLFRYGIPWEKMFLLHGVQQKKSFSNILNCSVVYPTPGENLFCCITHWKKICTAVSHNRGKLLQLYPTPQKKLKIK